MNEYAKAILKPGKEKSVLNRHPWIFASAIRNIENQPQNGDTIEVFSSKGEWLARGAYNSLSQIQVRLWTWDEAENIDQKFFLNRIQRAYEAREKLNISKNSNAYRVIFSEADELPGVIVDRYSTSLVTQFLCWGAEKWRDEIIYALSSIIPHSQIYERSDSDVRLLEGLPERRVMIKGSILENPVRITENGIRFLVDIVNGHKTGFYLDQRENRRIVAQYASGKDILDCFSYTGGMAIPCMLAGARSIECVETSTEALDQLEQNCKLNQIDKSRYIRHQGDVFNKLRAYRDQGKRFDMIILDPPKFAPTIKYVDKASRGYKDINLLALKLLNPGGILATFSCSGGVSALLFQKILFGAALDAFREAKIISYMTQGGDHPVALNFPESSYLKGFVLLVN